MESCVCVFNMVTIFQHRMEACVSDNGWWIIQQIKQPIKEDRYDHSMIII